MALQTVAAVSPASVAAADGDPVVTLEDGTNGCNGVRTTPGSENTLKELIGGSLLPGGTAIFKISFPVDPSDVAGRTTFVITDCVFVDGNAVLKYSVSFVPNTVDFVLTISLQIPAGTPIGSEYCNYAKTTAAPSESQASNRKAGPACFIVGGNMAVLKVNEDGDPLAGATFHIVCTLPTTNSFLPDTIINGETINSTSGLVITRNVTTGTNGRIVIQAPVGTSCVITETDAPPGYEIADDPSVTLVATANGVDHTFVNKVPAAPELSIVKTATEQSYDSVGDVIHYTIVATNTGNVTLHNVVVTDPNAVNLVCTPATPVTNLAVGASISCTADHTVTQADIDAGNYLNTACVNDGAGGATEKCDDADVPSDKNPALSIVKDATEANYDAVGDVIHYSITATNTGNVTLHNVVVTDPNAANLVCTPATPVTNLAPGGTITCTADHTITQADIDAGHYLNTACVNDGANGATEKCDDADVPSDKNPALSIVKDATEQSYDSVGDVIHYTIVATNTGNTTLAAVTVTDANATGLVCSPVNGSPLAPGASMSCTASHTITQADIDAGNYLNTACVDDGAGGATEKCDDADVPSDKNPHLSIVKDATEESYDSVGDVIHYTITATNDGNTTLDAVTVTDLNATGLVCSPVNGSPLAPGASMSCTASHTVTQADIDAGHYLNTACVDDGQGGAEQDCDDADVPSDQNPALSIVKDASESTYDSVGDVIHYTITATNTGNVTLHNVTITDPNAVNLVCTPPNPVSSLAPNGTINCTADHTITQADIDAGHYLNTACVDDGVAGAESKCDDANVPATSNNNLSIVKSATESTYSKVGDVLHYTIVATNTGNTTLHNVVVTDDNAVNLVCVPPTPVSDLAPGATISCTADHTVTQADIDAGHYLNTACVSATDASATCDDADVPSGKNPHLSIVKSATESSYDSVGDVIHYTITATNDGNTTLASVTVTDANATGLDCSPVNGSSLAPGASMSCTASHTITQADITAGHYLNTACVDAIGATTVCDDADVSNATLTITKSNNAPIDTLELPDGSTADLPTADEGSTVTYTLAYTIGQVDVTGGVIKDVLPLGLTYKTGSATGNAEFTFVDYNSTTRTLTWTAATVTTSGSVTYQVTVDVGASERPQPLENLATIDSDQTVADHDTSDVFVPVIPLAETNIPTPPPTDVAPSVPSNPGSGMALLLAVLGLMVLGIAFVTPAPAVIRRKNRR